MDKNLRKDADCLGEKLFAGVCITKYDHVMGPIDKVTCYEAGHLIPDENSSQGTQAAIDLVTGLSSSDTVIFLISGGGSALFELPLLSGNELQNITNQLLACSASIVEINTIRKRLSAVKGGKFAMLCSPAHVDAIILSDILGDPLDMIASGPACPDTTTREDAFRIVKKYDLKLSTEAMKLLEIETPKNIENVSTMINGSVRELCSAASKAAKALGYEPILLTDQLSCQAKEAGSFLGTILKTHYGSNQKLAFLAGGYVDYTSGEILESNNLSVYDVLKNNDSYNALAVCDGLIITGPTGTNVNDIAVALLDKE